MILDSQFTEKTATSKIFLIDTLIDLYVAYDIFLCKTSDNIGCIECNNNQRIYIIINSLVLLYCLCYLCPITTLPQDANCSFRF